MEGVRWREECESGGSEVCEGTIGMVCKDAGERW